MQTSYGHILTYIQEDELQATIQTFLSDLGFTVTQSNSIEQAQHFMKHDGPDLVISDLQKNPDSGLLFLSEFSHIYPDVPIITLTVPHQKQVLKSLRLGAWDCIEEPLENLTQLEHSVCKALERARLVNENKLYRHKLEEMNTQLEESLHELRYDQMAGKKVQAQMFPRSDLVLNQYHFSNFVLPSLYLSGDMVDYFAISEKHVGFYIADVSGHGASSAFVTIMIKALFDQLLMSYKQKRTKVILQPKKVFSIANEYLLNANLGKYVTMIYAVLNTETHRLRYSVAGHYPNPILVTSQQATFLPGRAFAVGMVKHAQFTDISIDLPINSKLALFSDGLMEVISGQTLDDKEKILLSAIEQVDKENSNLSTQALKKTFNIKETESRPDDITFLLMNRCEAIEGMKHNE